MTSRLHTQYMLFLCVALTLLVCNVSLEGSGDSVESTTKVEKCFVCNSEYDPLCKDPFNPKEAESLKQKCEQKASNADAEGKTQAVGCRKIEQEVLDKTRIVRQCAYGGIDMKGVKRTGNKGVRLFYWQCSEEGCNSAPPGARSFILAFLIPVLLVVVVNH